MPRKNKPRTRKQVKKPKRLVKKPKIKKNRRNQAKYPALEKKYNLLSRQELLDFDYIGKLNDKEKRWLNKFVEEEINASFQHPNPLNKSKKSRKVCYDRNNARNRCILTRHKALGNVEDLETVKEGSEFTPEDLMIGQQEQGLREELNNLDNTLDGSNKSQKSTEKK